jgi:hypothetical protein
MTTYIYRPVGLDLFDRSHPEHVGQRVVLTQPAGCPRNGTMGHVFIAEADTGAFIGLVLRNSLQRA